MSLKQCVGHSITKTIIEMAHRHISLSVPHLEGLHTDLETLAGCFVLSVFCESLIVDP
jgi:hypothetical protein